MRKPPTEAQIHRIRTLFAAGATDARIAAALGILPSAVEYHRRLLGLRRRLPSGERGPVVQINVRCTREERAALDARARAAALPRTRWLIGLALAAPEGALPGGCPPAPAAVRTVGLTLSCAPEQRALLHEKARSSGHSLTRWLLALGLSG